MKDNKSLDLMYAYSVASRNERRGYCKNCKNRDQYGVCTKIKDIMGYELIVENECIFSDNFTFTEVEE